jgi:hypothetical protein
VNTNTPTNTSVAPATNTPQPTATHTATRTPTPEGQVCPDVSGDGRVTIIDLMLMRLGLLFQRFGIYLERFDVNDDGRVDFADVRLVSEHLGERCPGGGHKGRN